MANSVLQESPVSLPAADSTSNTTSGDVVGNKTDAAVTTVGTTKTIVAYVKGLLNRAPASGTLATQSDVQTGPTVPNADVTTNTGARDVVGNKTDAEVTTVGTTKTVIAYLKGIVTWLTVATTDGTANASAKDVIGAKDDAAQQTIGTTRSLMAYVKALLTNYTTTLAGYLANTQFLNNANVDSAVSSQTSGTSSIYSAYTQLIASTAGAAKWLYVTVSCGTLLTNDDIVVQFATGGGGSETDVFPFKIVAAVGASVGVLIPFSIPNGTRVSYRSYAEGVAAATVRVSIAVLRP